MKRPKTLSGWVAALLLVLAASITWRCTKPYVDYIAFRSDLEDLAATYDGAGINEAYQAVDLEIRALARDHHIHLDPENLVIRVDAGGRLHVDATWRVPVQLPLVGTWVQRYHLAVPPAEDL